ncbi:phage major capsid protein [Rhodococcus phenolicus]|uniref:phage major capsid protein n=1 Tax=Rhodococcus phenolicus TaxID=263849 RepID=UPI0008329CF2|nr:phage major capsid protein [Rhodococcus phenolicus]
MNASTKAKLAELQKSALAHAQKARTIAEKAEAEGRNFTAAEKAAYDEAMATGKSELDQINTIKADANIHDQAKALAEQLDGPGVRPMDGFGDGSPAAPAKRRGLPFTRKSGAAALAKSIAGTMATSGGGQKALAPSGTVVTGIPMGPEAPVVLADPGATLLDALGIVPGAPTYRYLRQITRTNNAAVVAVGETKPTSTMGLEEIEGKLRIVAHLSEGIHEYWLRDSASLNQFVEGELLQGLLRAIENEVVNGDGTGEHFTGLAHVSGAQVQAFAVDSLTTIRKAITKLEVAGHAAGLITVHPTDWEALELSRTTGDGQLELVDSPVDRAARRLWGVQVVPSVAVTTGTAIVLDTAAVAVRTDDQVETRWDTSGAQFEKNETRARVETRANLDVYQPMGVVLADLTA